MTIVPMKELPAHLVELIHGLNAGESLTFVSELGEPEAVLVAIDSEQESLQTNQHIEPIRDEWFADWDRMARAIAKDWKINKSAVDVLSEMRR